MRIGIFGKTGSGKTQLVKKLLKGLENNLVILDLHNEYSDVNGYRFVPKSYEQILNFFDYIENMENKIFVFEDIDYYAYDVKNQIFSIFSLGRHKNQSVIYLTRRPYLIPRIITVNTNYFIVFRTKEPRDLKYFYDCGLNVSIIKNLKDYEYYIYKT